MAEIEVYQERKKLSELTVNKIYKILDAAKEDTQKFGEKVTVTFKDGNVTYTSYVPKRVNEYLLADGERLENFIKESASGTSSFKFLGGPYNNMNFIKNVLKEA